MALKRSWMPRPKSPMRPMSAKRLANVLANGGGYPSSTFLKLPRTSRPFEVSGVEGSAGGVGVGVPVKSLRPRAGGAASEGWLAHSRPTGHRVEPDLAAIVRKRSGGRCEIGMEGCWGEALEKSHRIARGAGGRHGVAKRLSDRPSNLLDSCVYCHLAITRYASKVKAKDNGWVLKDRQDPSREPVLYRGVPSYLDDVGGVWSLEEVGA